MTLAPGIDYVTDQFVDPITGFTVQDDGTNNYFCPSNGRTYIKHRTANGFYISDRGTNVTSYQITLTLDSGKPVLLENKVDPVELENNVTTLDLE